MLLDEFGKQKIQQAQLYLNETDKDFLFYFDKQLDSQKHYQIILNPIDMMPSLNRYIIFEETRYKILEMDVKQLNEKEFQGVQAVRVICEKYLKLLKDDQQALNSYTRVNSSQLTFKKEKDDVLSMVKQISQIIKNQLQILKKEHFMQILMREIKIINQRAHYLLKEFHSFITIKMIDTIDLKYYDQITSAIDIANLDPFESISKLNLFIERSINSIAQRLDDMLKAPKYNQANRGLQLSILMQKLFSDQQFLLSEKNCLFNKVAYFLYNRHSSIAKQCAQEINEVEKFVARLNESSSELIYLSFILKKEIKHLEGINHQLSVLYQEIVKTVNIELVPSWSNVSLSKSTQLCQTKLTECDSLIMRINQKSHFKHHFGDHGMFIGALGKKMDSRSKQLKELKHDVKFFKSILQGILIVLANIPQINSALNQSRDIIQKVGFLAREKTILKSNLPEFEQIYQQCCGITAKLNEFLKLMEGDVLYPNDVISQVNRLEVELWQEINFQIDKQYQVQSTLKYIMQQLLNQ